VVRVTSGISKKLKTKITFYGKINLLCIAAMMIIYELYPEQAVDNYFLPIENERL
jgi:hypothetical protein